MYFNKVVLKIFRQIDKKSKFKIIKIILIVDIFL